ncbi:MAG: conjugal transfer protein TraX [Synergistaceae bacterium]|nr:conjugal transfer protein TraX [Synergistaceae bacterium]
MFELNANESKKYGWEMFSGFQLKVIGIVLMVFDHLHQMFYVFGAPVWFTWLGRPVAPIFLFLSAEGYRHTRSKARYMLLLLAGFELMSAVSDVMTLSMRSDDLSLINNIFGTLFVSVLYMALADLFMGAVREKNPGRFALALLSMLLPPALGIAPLLMDESMPFWLQIAMLKYIPNPVTVEGGFLFVLMGVLFHLFRDRRRVLAAIPVAYGIFSFFFIDGAQWLMAAAALPILAYNGKRGPGGALAKYFFYAFYPAHICLFYIIAWRMSN